MVISAGYRTGSSMVNDCSVFDNDKALLFETQRSPTKQRCRNANRQGTGRKLNNGSIESRFVAAGGEVS